MTKKLNIAVMFGGRSGEHAVSLMSARYVLSQLDPAKYAITQIGITRDGRWWVGEDVLSALEAEDTSPLQPATLLPDPTQAGLMQIGADEQLQTLADLEVIFPVLHGTFGEDGTLQGLFEMAGVAYVGAGVLGSSLAMDKAVFFELMRAHDIPVVDTVLVLRSELQADPDAVLDKVEQLGAYPLFVKPANLGSSVGISKVTSRSDLVEGLMEAAQYDRRLIVQRGHNVREIEISVLGNDQPEASVPGEIVPGAEFYSYESKYHDDRSEAHIPAEITVEQAAQVKEMAIRAYRACDLAGMARVDFFVDKDSGAVLLNEINTIPGFTSISMYPMLWLASGLEGPQLVDRLIELALERQAERQATTHEFRRGK